MHSLLLLRHQLLAHLVLLFEACLPLALLLGADLLTLTCHLIQQCLLEGPQVRDARIRLDL